MIFLLILWDTTFIPNLKFLSLSYPKGDGGPISIYFYYCWKTNSL